jgi:DNA-binding response OmpR family regulator
MNAAQNRVTVDRVLLVIGQSRMAMGIERAFALDGFHTRSVSNLFQAERTFRQWLPHLVILDLDLVYPASNLVPADPLDLAGMTPVICLTRRHDVQTKLAAFDSGVDDIVTIPFHPLELLARGRAVLRRACPSIPDTSPVCGPYGVEIDPLRRQVIVDAREVRLSATDHRLLYLLATNAGRILTRDEILDRLWGADFAADSNVVDRHIRNLRAKLLDDWQRPRFIATVPGRGYCFLPQNGEAGDCW